MRAIAQSFIPVLVGAILFVIVAMGVAYASECFPTCAYQNNRKLDCRKSSDPTTCQDCCDKVCAGGALTLCYACCDTQL
jgi:hypothetical protein